MGVQRGRGSAEHPLCQVVLYSVGRMIGGRLRLSNEHSDAKWLTFDEALQLNLKPEIRKAMIALEDILRQEARRPSG